MTFSRLLCSDLFRETRRTVGPIIAIFVFQATPNLVTVTKSMVSPCKACSCVVAGFWLWRRLSTIWRTQCSVLFISFSLSSTLVIVVQCTCCASLPRTFACPLPANFNFAPFFSMYGENWDCFVFDTTSFPLRYDIFSLLIIQNVSDHGF